MTIERPWRRRRRVRSGTPRWSGISLSQSIPQYILVQSPQDLRTPQALADLEQMASRIAQLPDIALVSGVTRPLGEVPPEFRATFQAGIVGDRLAAGSAQIGERTDDLNKLAAGATRWPTPSATCAHRSTRSRPVSTACSTRSRRGDPVRRDKLVRDVRPPPSSSTGVNKLGNSMGMNFAAVGDLFGWIGPVLTALHGNAVCDANPSCSDTRIQFERIAGRA